MCLQPFVTREMQIKPCDIELHTRRIEKKQKRMIPNVGKAREWLEMLRLRAVKWNDRTTLGSCWAVSYKGPHSPTRWLHSFTPTYLLKRNENISHDWYTNVRNSLVHYSPKPETTQMSSCGWGVSKHGLFLQGNITMKKKYTFSTHPTTRWLLKTHWERGDVHKSVCTLWLHLQQVLKQVTRVLLVLGRAEAAWCGGR